MSSIAFHTKEKTVYVGGRERAYCSVLIGNIFRSIVDLEGMRFDGDKAKRIFVALGLGEDPAPMMLRYALSTAGGGMREIAGEEWDLFQCELNTIVKIGSDSMKFIAWIHGQCEIHLWVDGPNRAWLADIIDEGLKIGILREESQGYDGWGKVAELLRESDEGEVVTSYSVTESFPHFDYEKDELMTWEDSIEWLKKRGGGTEMKPEEWNEFHFGEGKTAFDLVAKLESLIE